MAKRPKPTRGPWKANYYGDYEGCVSGGGAIIAEIDRRLATLNPKAQKRTEADLLLIAAAPELFEALELARDHIDMTALEVSHCKDAERIRSAIAKARGALFNSKLTG
jgi:hypothetical protein